MVGAPLVGALGTYPHTFGQSYQGGVPLPFCLVL